MLPWALQLLLANPCGCHPPCEMRAMEAERDITKVLGLVALLGSAAQPKGTHSSMQPRRLMGLSCAESMHRLQPQMGLRIIEIGEDPQNHLVQPFTPALVWAEASCTWPQQGCMEHSLLLPWKGTGSSAGRETAGRSYTPLHTPACTVGAHPHRGCCL